MRPDGSQSIGERLTAAKDLILPGIWGRNIDADIIVNFHESRLDLRVDGKLELLATLAEIDDQDWKTVGERIKRFPEGEK